MAAVGGIATPPTGLTFIKGSPIDFESKMKEGQTVFVFEMWATWCGPCRQIIPHVSQLQARMRSAGVEFVGITQEDESKAKPFVDKMGNQMDYTVACDDGGVVEREYMQKYGVQGIPHAFVVGKDGKIVYQGHPADPKFEPAIVAASQVPGKAAAPPAIDVSGMTADDLAKLSIKELKAVLSAAGVDSSSAIEERPGRAGEDQGEPGRVDEMTTLLSLPLGRPPRAGTVPLAQGLFPPAHPSCWEEADFSCQLGGEQEICPGPAFAAFRRSLLGQFALWFGDRSFSFPSS
jgi:thiol-disulfide isomerase/thioredoxin